ICADCQVAAAIQPTIAAAIATWRQRRAHVSARMIDRLATCAITSGANGVVDRAVAAMAVNSPISSAEAAAAAVASMFLRRAGLCQARAKALTHAAASR